MKPNPERDQYFRDIGAPPPTPEERQRDTTMVPFGEEPPPHSDADLEHLNGDAMEVDPPSAVEPLEFSSAAEWEGEPIPDREWLVHEWIPAANVTLLSGDGAIGKTTLALQLAVAVVCGSDWIGGLVDMPGTVLFFSAEEEKPEIQRRLDAIRVARRLQWADLAELRVKCVPSSKEISGGDSTLALPNSQGVMEPTELWARMQASIVRMRPALVVIEAAADVFGGKEIDRRQVSQFVRMLRQPAIETRASIVVLSHPSVIGRNTGSGEAGSTQWHNSVRSRLYLTSPRGTGKDEADDDANTDQRILRFMKSNYGPKGRPLQLCWEGGIYVPIGGGSTLERAAAEAAVDEVFLRCLTVRKAQGIDVGRHPGRSYAPAEFAKMPEAGGQNKRALSLAMERLLSAGRIKVDTIGPASKSRSILIRAEDDDA